MLGLPFTMASRRTWNKAWLGLFGWVLVAFLPATTAVFVETGAWYASLNRPAWTPPSWVFGPVWAILYLLMGVAAWRVWMKRGFGDRAARLALALFLVHLVFNAAWTLLFFGAHLLTAAAVEIVSLWLMIVALVALFWRIDRVAGYLLIPYLLWVSYAVTLSVGFAVMNPG